MWNSDMYRPPVIADGAPCPVAFRGIGMGPGPDCDAFAECFDPSGPAGRAGASGTCTLQIGSACR
jgi:hypothetical protein